MKLSAHICGAGFLLCGLMANASISLTGGTTTEVWSFLPEATEWSTRTIDGDHNTITGITALDNAINALFADTVNTKLGSSITTPASQFSLFRFNGERENVQSHPVTDTGAYNVLQANLLNSTGFNITALSLSYDYSQDSSVSSEEIFGLRVYYSVNGTTWMVIPELSVDTTETYPNFETLSSTVILAAPVADGANLWVRWVDDNSTSGEKPYLMDNISFTPTVPEPATGLLALTGATGLGFMRLSNRDRKSTHSQ